MNKRYKVTMPDGSTYCLYKDGSRGWRWIDRGLVAWSSHQWMAWEQIEEQGGTIEPLTVYPYRKAVSK